MYLNKLFGFLQTFPAKNVNNINSPSSEIETSQTTPDLKICKNVAFFI